MKRSEMVDKMALKIFEFTREIEEYPNYSMMTVREFNQVLATKLLAFQVSEGMRPPETTIADPGHFPGDSFEYQVNEWEDE
jgi:hypothetical protein